jgi:hypothetical protein
MSGDASPGAVCLLVGGNVADIAVVAILVICILKSDLEP